MMEPSSRRHRHPLAVLEPSWLKLAVYYCGTAVLGVIGYALVIVLRGQQQLRRQQRQHGLFNR